MSIPVQTQLPDNLINQAQELIKAGWANNLDDLLADALRRYLESHSLALSEKFLLDDVQWGLHGSD
ncbi:MAG: ribbon-helix-helix domain-containing protein [Thiolinea sp.]